MAHVAAGQGRPGPERAAGGSAEPPLPSDPAVLEQQIEEHRRRLAATLDELAHRASPQEVKRRTVEGAKAKVRHATTTEDGSLRVERVAAAAGAVLLLVVLAVVNRRRRG